MSDLEQNGRQFSDAEYLEAMAKHFDGQIVPELRAHAERLRAIATLQAPQQDLLEALKGLLDYALGEAEKRGFDPPIPSEIVAGAQYAIAKATGQL